MMTRFFVLSIFIVLFAVVLTLVLKENKQVVKESANNTSTTAYDPLSIEGMRVKLYPGSDIVIEEELPQGSNYRQYITSYNSEGYKIYGLLTVPETQRPENGYPVIIFNHGYIPP